MTHKELPAAAALADDFVRRYPEEAAAQLEGLDPPELVDILCGESDTDAVALLSALRPEVAAEVIVRAGEKERSRWVSAMNPSRTAIVLSRLDEEVRTAVLGGLGARVASEVKAIMSYPPETAGALMDPQVSHFRADSSAESALMISETGRFSSVSRDARTCISE